MKIECLRQVCRTKCTNKWTNGQRLALTELLSEPKNIWSIEIYMMMRTSLLNWLCEFEAHSTSGIIIFHWTAQHISLCNGKFILFWSCLSIFPTKSSNLLTTSWNYGRSWRKLEQTNHHRLKFKLSSALSVATCRTYNKLNNKLLFQAVMTLCRQNIRQIRPRSQLVVSSLGILGLWVVLATCKSNIGFIWEWD